MTWPLPTFSRMAATVDSMKWAGVQSPRRAADIEDEVLDELRAERRVVHFRMELHGPDAALRAFEPCQSICRNSSAMKARGELGGLVAVAHPDGEGCGQSGKELRCTVFNGDFRMAVLAAGRIEHLAAEMMDDEVQSIADSQDRQAQFEQLGISGGGVSVVNRRRPAGEDEAQGLERLNLADGRGAGQHDGEDVVFADAARNQLRVLRTEVEDDDCLGVHVFSVAGRIPGLQAKLRREAICCVKANQLTQ